MREWMETPNLSGGESGKAPGTSGFEKLQPGKEKVTS